jgi:hypothetical protein
LFRSACIFSLDFVSNLEEVLMGEIIHTARIRLVQKKRPFRDAHIEGFKEPLQFGTHGAYAKYYGVKDAAPLPTTIDHVISALAG